MTRPLPLALLLALAAGASAQPSLGVGDSLSGTLQKGDDQLTSGEWADVVVLPDAPASELRLTTDAFRPYLIVRSADGEATELEAPADWPLGLSFRVPASGGPWTVFVTTHAPGEEGAYTLRRRERPGHAPLAGAVDAELSVDDEWTSDGRFAEGYTLQSDGTPFEVRLETDAFDGQLVLGSPSDAVLVSDDHLGDPATSAVFVGSDDAEAGAWTVYVSALGVREHGPYRLTTGPTTDAEAARQRALHDAVVAVFEAADPTPEALLRAGDWHGAAQSALALADAVEALDPDLRVRASLLAKAGLALASTDRADEAERVLLAARALSARLYGPDRPQVAYVDLTLGDLYRERGRFDEAEAVLTRALATIRRALPADHPEQATAETNLGVLRLMLGDHAGAVGPLERALDVYESRGVPADSSSWATLYSNLAATYVEVVDYDAAAAAAARSAEVRPAGDPDVWYTTNMEGLLAYRLGDYERARERYDVALAQVERAYGAESAQAAVVLRNAAEAVRARGDLVGARALLARAVAVDEATLPAGHSNRATSLLSFAALLHDLGDRAPAQRAADEALALVEAAYSPSHVRVVEARHIAAITRFRLGGGAEGRAARTAAVELLARAFRDGAEANGLAHPSVSYAGANLARYLLLSGDAASSLDVLGSLLAAQADALGADHPETAATRLARANAHMVAGDYAAAQADAAAASAAFAAAVGDLHPSTLGARSEAVLFDLLAGDVTAAGATLGRVAGDASRFAAVVLPTLAPAEQAGFSQKTLPDLTSSALTVWAEGGEGAYPEVGAWRGILLQGLRRQAAARSLADDPAAGPLVRRVEALRAELARAVATGDDPDGVARRKEEAERALAAALPALADPWAGPEALAAALPPDAVFADVYRYQHLGGDRDGWRYAAVVTSADGTALVALGPADPLDAAAEAWRLDRARSGDATAALGARLWGPLLDALPPGTRRVWVAPDGALVRLPWGVLAEAHDAGAPLVAQVPSGRALAGLLTGGAAPAGGRALVVGGVDFGPGGAWSPLPGAAREADAVARSARSAGLDAQSLGGAEATPAAVARAAAGAAYVHLATHGYFGGTTASDYARGPRTDEEAPSAATSPGAVEGGRNPLVETGLALAGANAGPEGLLTAEEVVSLDLAAARLVVLSACDTGRGAEVTGQGVLGLQAAVQAAGARALLMSLWPVDDAATAVLMAAFYDALWGEGARPADALRTAQAAVRARPEWAAPVFWAGWALVGDVF